jgi:enoyl-CoA hydratase/carnithine racemase
MSVKVRREGPVAVITLDWPESRNALTVERIAQLDEAIRGLDDDALGLVLTGNGAFCAGANLPAVVSRRQLGPAEREREIRSIAQAMVRALVSCRVPTFAAVDGPAIGLGLDLALACDSVLVGPQGWLMQGWGRVGVIPGTGGELLLRVRNPRLLWRWLATQERVDADAAERWSIGEAVRQGTACEVAIERARAIASMPRGAIYAYVELNRGELRALLPAHLDHCATVQAQLLSDAELEGRVARILGGSAG